MSHYVTRIFGTTFTESFSVKQTKRHYLFNKQYLHYHPRHIAKRHVQREQTIFFAISKYKQVIAASDIQESFEIIMFLLHLIRV